MILIVFNWQTWKPGFFTHYEQERLAVCSGRISSARFDAIACHAAAAQIFASSPKIILHARTFTLCIWSFLS
jgi:hypothetical protein